MDETRSRKLAVACCAALLAACTGAQAPAPARPPAGSPPAAAPVAGALPLDPARLAELKAALDELQGLTDLAKGSSPQGRSRLVQQQIQRFLDSSDPGGKLPFRKNLEKVVTILSESGGEELSEGQKAAVQQEIQAIRKELGLDQASGSSSEGSVPPPPPPGPGGPGPAGPAPGGSAPGGPAPGGPGPAGPGGPRPGPPTP